MEDISIQWKGFIKPKGIEWDEKTLSSTYGKFIAQPLERGHGITIGNSLRRILLSSLTGAAVTSVKIQGVQHEFSTIPGIVEDVPQIILNLKQLLLRLPKAKPKTLYLKAQGPLEVKASHITKDADVEILNPDLYIATLNEKGKLSMEIEVNVGRGYVTTEKHEKKNNPIGTIPIDSIFTPIKKVSYRVENTRVGKITDYDRLILEVWTDGSVRPDDALAFAAKILKSHLDLFITFPEPKEEVEVKKEDRKIDEILNKSLEEVELSVRSANCLKEGKIKTIGQLTRKSEEELLKMRNFGKKSVEEIKEILKNYGLSLGMKK
ncbi:DNA-directed RNA polymerase subunit alpha [bacterium]|nr:DNA-directed RNA polymerase subunit alpha [bacterium]